MLKYLGDIVEKLTVGGLCIGILQSSTKGAIIVGVAGLAAWTMLRIVQTRREKKGGK